MNKTTNDEKVDLNEFAKLAGFPVELIQKELFSDSEVSSEETSLEDLRAAMVSYLNKTMLES